MILVYLKRDQEALWISPRPPSEIEWVFRIAEPATSDSSAGLIYLCRQRPLRVIHDFCTKPVNVRYAG
jgi:hypothetical protein